MQVASPLPLAVNMDARCRTLFQLALLLGASPGICQSLVYTEPGVASCSALPLTNNRVVCFFHRE
jgi:hypothetical protein